MVKNMWRVSLVFTSVMAVFSASLCAEAGEALDKVPDGAVGIIAARSISDFQGDAGAFLDAIQPGASAQIGFGLQEFYTFGTGVAEGIDLDSAVVFAIFPSVGEEPDGEVSFVPVVIVPLADESAWRAALGERLAKDEESGFESTDDGDGYVTVEDGIATSCETGEQLKAVKAALSTPLSAARRAAIEEALVDAPLVLEFSVAALRKVKPDLLDEVSAESLEIPDAQELKMIRTVLDIYLDVAKDLFESSESVLVQLSPSAAGVNVAATLEMARGNLFAEAFAAQKPSDLGILDEMPDGSMVYFAGGVDIEPLADYTRDIAEKFVRSASEGLEEEQLQQALDGVRQGIEDSLKYGLGKDFGGAVFRDAQTGTFGMMGAYRTASAAEALEAAEAQSAAAGGSAIANLWLSAAGGAVAAPEAADETIDGVDVKVITYELNFEDADPQIGAMMDALYGGEIVTRMAAKGDMFYFTLGPKANMEELLTGVAAVVPTDKVARSLDTFKGKPSAVILYSIPDAMLLGMSMASGMMPQQAGTPQMQAPPTSRFLAAAVSFDGPAARFELNVPTEQINAAKMMMMQMMMQQMQQQGGPGGPGAPPWQPEAPEE